MRTDTCRRAFGPAWLRIRASPFCLELFLQRPEQQADVALGGLASSVSSAADGIVGQDVGQALAHEERDAMHLLLERTPFATAENDQSRAVGVGEVVDEAEVAILARSGPQTIEQAVEQPPSTAAAWAAKEDVLVVARACKAVLQGFGGGLLAQCAVKHGYVPRGITRNVVVVGLPAQALRRDGVPGHVNVLANGFAWCLQCSCLPCNHQYYTRAAPCVS